MQTHSRHAAPLFIKDGQLPTPLNRYVLGQTVASDDRREKFIEDLVFENPTIIPMHEIEPAFMPLVSICKQLPTPAGELDNLWLTPTGGIVLGECKLVRNTQARREVLVQALDYARALKGWHYDDLQNAVRIALKDPLLSLWQLVQGQTTEGEGYGEADFSDAIDRRLREGRFVVLAILDGVQEGLEALTGYLQLHAGLHASIALVELSIWQGIEGGLLIVPRIPLRTVLIERGIVTIDAAGTIRIDEPRDLKANRSPKPFTASEPEFYDRLEQNLPGMTARLRAFLTDLENIGVVPEFGRSVVLRWHPSPDIAASAGYIDATGAAWLGDALFSATKLGNSLAGYAYLDQVARMVGGTVQRYENPNNAPRVKGPDGKTVNISHLLTHSGEWKAAIAALLAGTNQTSSKD